MMNLSISWSENYHDFSPRTRLVSDVPVQQVISKVPSSFERSAMLYFILYIAMELSVQINVTQNEKFETNGTKEPNRTMHSILSNCLLP